MQATPFVPQTVFVVPVWHWWFASQQPPGQLSKLQTHAPATHSCPAAHTTHAAPSAPHWESERYVMQVVPSQHPVEQSDASQYATQI
jgi:hypothetical protein